MNALAIEDIACPKCQCTRLRKKGTRQISNGDISRRFLCKECGYRFYYRPHAFGKIRLKADKGEFDLFHRTLERMKKVEIKHKDFVMKYDINPASIKREMRYTKLDRSTIWRWLNRFYPEWKNQTNVQSVSEE